MRSQTVPLYVQIQNFIRIGIANGRFTDGARLPSEPELAQRFATTRSTVAKALQQLAFEGVISRRIGSGTYVGSGRSEDRVDTTELAPFASFEQHVLAGGERLEYELLGFSARAANTVVAERLQLAEGDAVFQLERLRLVEGIPTAVEVRFIPEAIGLRIDEDQLRTRTVQNILGEQLGFQIDRFENAVSAAVATERLAKLLQLRRGAPLLVREHTIFEQPSRPLLYGKAFYGSEFKIHYTLHSSERK